MDFYGQADCGFCIPTMAEAESGCIATVQYLVSLPCEHCGARGKKGLFRCRSCNGTGYTTYGIDLRVSLPAGVQDDQVLEYFVLKEAAKRLLPAGYRLYAKFSLPQSFPGADLTQIFEQFFGGGFTGPAQPNSDIHCTLKLSAKEAQRGGSKELSYSFSATCRHCGGSGEAVADTSPVCPLCNGAKIILRAQQTPFGKIQSKKVCKRCHGKGILIHNPCPICEGKGLTQETEQLSIPLPRGTQNGYSVTLPGKGNELAEQRGKLTVTMQVAGQARTAGQPSRVFDMFMPSGVPTPPVQPQPDAENICLQLELSPEEAAAGCTRTICYNARRPCQVCGGRNEFSRHSGNPCSECEGSGLAEQPHEITLPVPAGIKTGQTLAIKSKGHFITKRHFSDVLVQITVVNT